MNTKELGQIIQSFAPLSLQEHWDNSGYNIDLENENIRCILLCLDVTQDVIAEAQDLQCDVIISHHPLLFHEIRRVDASVFPGTLLTRLIRAGISLYCAHTTMDSAAVGINRYVASRLGMQQVKPLVPASGENLLKLSVTVPVDSAAPVRDALFAAGAGALGNYSECSFSVRGEGTFRPGAGASPAVGSIGSREYVDETQVQVLISDSIRDAALEALGRTHPYEVPAVDIYPVQTGQPVQDGLGCIGALKEPISLRTFAESVKSALECPAVEYTSGPDCQVSRVALCTGAGGSLIDAAIAQGADVLVTGEVRHNDFSDARLPIVQAGHYDTEKWFVYAMQDALQDAGLIVQYNVDIRVAQSMERPYSVI